MKRFLGFALILGLFSVPGFAASNSKNVTFPNPVTVGAKQLPAGDYKVSWTGEGSAVQVTILQKNARHPLTVTVPAKLETEKDGRTGLTISSQNGTEMLKAIQINKINLILTGATENGE